MKVDLVVRNARIVSPRGIVEGGLRSKMAAWLSLLLRTLTSPRVTE